MLNKSLRKIINVDSSNLIPLYTFKQEDDAVLLLSLFKNSTSFDITGQTVTLGIKRPNGTLVNLEGTNIFTIDKNNLDIKLKNSCLSVPGICECDLEFVDTTGKMTTASFFITVNRKVVNDTNVQATNEISIINKIKLEEEQRLLNENTRKEKESIRINLEKERVLSEDVRTSNETNRVASETIRANTEVTRVNNESIRVNNENIRGVNETTRTKNEETRIGEFETIKKDYDTYKNVMIAESNVAALQKEINTVNSQLDSIVQDTNDKFNGFETKKADKIALEVERQRINNFTALAQGSTTGDAELIDGRIGDDGKTYDNIGSAIRGQINNVLDKKFLGSTEIGKYLALNGEVYVDNRAKVTDYISVLPNDVVKLSIKYPLTEFCYGLYDADKNKISIISYSLSTTEYDIVIPKNARYIRATLTRASSVGRFSDCVFVTSNINSLISKTIEYMDNIEEKIEQDMLILENKLNTIQPSQLGFINVKENLYNPKTITSGYISNNGSVVSNSTFRYTSLIKVSAGDVLRTTYDANLAGQSCQFYNSNGNFFVSGQSYTKAIGTSYFETNIPSGASYIKCNFTANKATTYIIVKNELYDENLSGITDATITMKNGYIFDNGVDIDDVENGYLWQNVCCIGDSLTAGVYSDTYTGKGYPYFLEKMLKCTTTNLGLGGRTTKTWWEQKDTNFTTAQLNFSKYDCFIIFLGTNGGLTGNVDASEDSLMGYYCKIINKCKTEAPNSSIFLVSFPWSQNRDYYYSTMVTPLETLSDATGLPIIHLDKSKILTYNNRFVNQPYDKSLHYGKLGYLRMASEIKRCMNEIVEANPSTYAKLK